MIEPRYAYNYAIIDETGWCYEVCSTSRNYDGMEGYIGSVMLDVFFEEIECDDPETWLRQRLAGKSLELTVEQGTGGAVTIHAVVDGMTEKFVFTPF